MANMDITPQELRDIEIREAWRGYHRDDVDELLERAAATIEHLESEVAQARGRGGQAPAPAVAPPPRPAAVPAAPIPVAVPAETRMADADVIQRTLLLAQKAADEAVSEAKAKASQIVAESESHAQALVAEAEATARRIADAEKSRLETEVGQLIAARDTLTSDVEALTKFETEYKERLRRAIETELESLAEMRSLAGQRPVISDVDLPTASVAASTESWVASQETVVVQPAPERSPEPTVHIAAAAAAAGGDTGWDPAPAGGWGEAPTAHVVDDSIEMEVPAHGDSLDDDAFFASLREAVRDEAPLGPGSDDQTRFYDQEDPEDHRGLFKRRR